MASSITIINNNQPYYLLGLIDGYSRLAWVEVLESKEALDVMFATLKLHLRYGIEVDTVSKYIHKKSGEVVSRYRSKDCYKTFSDKVRKFTYADKERFLEIYLNNVGIRKSSKFLGCSPSLLFRWVREFAGNLRIDLSKVHADLSSNSLPEVIEMAEIYTCVKKWVCLFRYGLLILGGEVMLHIQ